MDSLYVPYLELQSFQNIGIQNPYLEMAAKILGILQVQVTATLVLVVAFFVYLKSGARSEATASGAAHGAEGRSPSDWCQPAYTGREGGFGMQPCVLVYIKLTEYIANSIQYTV